MNVYMAPGRPNTLRLGASLQLRIDLRSEKRLEGRARLRGYLGSTCDGSAVYDRTQNVAEFHAHVTDEEEGLDFVILVFSGIPPQAYLTLDVDTGVVSRKTVFQGKTLRNLREIAS